MEGCIKITEVHGVGKVFAKATMHHISSSSHLALEPCWASMAMHRRHSIWQFAGYEFGLVSTYRLSSLPSMAPTINGGPLILYITVPTVLITTHVTELAILPLCRAFQPKIQGRRQQSRVQVQTTGHILVLGLHCPANHCYKCIAIIILASSKYKNRNRSVDMTKIYYSWKEIFLALENVYTRKHGQKSIQLNSSKIICEFGYAKDRPILSHHTTYVEEYC